MNEAKGKEVANQVRLLGKLAALHDEDELRELLDANGRSLLIGPILTPTAYGAGHERVQAMSDVVRAVLKLREAYLGLVQVVEETEPKAQRARAEAAAILGQSVPEQQP